MDPFTTAQALETARHYLDKVVDAPLKEFGELLADQIRFWRLKNQIKMILKSRELLEKKGIDPRKARPDTVFPLIEAAGDIEDETLSDMFAGLLASSLNPDTYDTVHPSYAKVLSQLAPLDATIMSGLYDSLNIHRQSYSEAGMTLQLVAEKLGIPEAIVLLSFQNLWRLGICSHGAGLDLLNQAKQIFFAEYGWALMKACIP
jgi:hypothetical protein